jgi:hypothetical protein
LELPSFAKATEGNFPSPCDGKLERAKRLELSERKSEAVEVKSNIENYNTGCTQIDTHGDAEFAEIAAAWPQLSPEIRAALLAVTRTVKVRQV